MSLARRPVLVAPDSFKGSLSANEVARAIACGLDAGGWVGDIAPLGDGGEGTASVLLEMLGGRTEVVQAHDPLGRVVEASFALLGDGRAVVEVAGASGLELVADGERDAEAASSAGTGELIVAAALAGARHVLVGAGGSATSDGGAGAIAAIERAGGLGHARLTVLCDVRTPFELAAPRFAPQKGADAPAVARLTRRLDAMAARLRHDPRGVPMTGAAGGLAGGLWATFDATLVAGAPFVLDAIDFDRRLRAAQAVVLGEGRLDETTLDGKVLAEAATRARQLGVPAHAIVAINDLNRFDQRILDLQTIQEARSERELRTAATKLARSL